MPHFKMFVQTVWHQWALIWATVQGWAALLVGETQQGASNIHHERLLWRQLIPAKLLAVSWLMTTGFTLGKSVVHS